MGKHSMDRCVICKEQHKDMTWISWYQNADGTKGNWFCSKHETIEVRRYSWGEK